ncbi:MAG: NfeD family protein [Isosphaeraceae bacterium]
MTTFAPRDHQGVLLDPGAPAQRGRGQFTVGQLMKTVLIVGVSLAIAVRRPDLIAFPGFYLILLVLGAFLYGLSWFPLPVRLAVELTIAVALLILAAWIWRPPFYVDQAERSAQLARLCARMAEKAIDDGSANLYWSEGRRYERLASWLRFRAMWCGLIRSATKEDLVPMDDRDLVRDLALLESLDQHRQVAEKMGIRSDQ